jgi:hypothetical protein
MAALVVLAGLAFTAMLVFLALAVVGLVLRTAIRIVLFPLFLIKWLVTGMVMLVVGPILLVVGAIAFVAVALAMALPLLPIVAIGAVIWLLVKSSRRVVAA